MKNYVPNLPNSDDDRRQDNRRKGAENRRIETYGGDRILVAFILLAAGMLIGGAFGYWLG